METLLKQETERSEHAENLLANREDENFSQKQKKF